MLGGGTGPADGTNATTCTPGPWNIARMLQAAEALPVNWGVYGKGNASRPDALREQIEAGACGLKAHEDWGTTPAVIDAALRVADEYDVQVAIHTDTLNEAGFVEDTIAAIAGRTIHTYHTEGAGGGHAPDIIRIAGAAERPAVVHQPDPAVHGQHARRAPRHADGLPPPEPGRAARTSPSPRAGSGPRRWPPRTSSTTAASSRCTRPTRRRWAGSARRRSALFQTAHKMRHFHGPLAGDDGNDNGRILRYLAKLTINPALTHGIAPCRRLARSRATSPTSSSGRSRSSASSRSSSSRAA